MTFRRGNRDPAVVRVEVAVRVGTKGSQSFVISVLGNSRADTWGKPPLREQTKITSPVIIAPSHVINTMTSPIPRSTSKLERE
jgi:hypothetical protein